MPGEVNFFDWLILVIVSAGIGAFLFFVFSLVSKYLPLFFRHARDWLNDERAPRGRAQRTRRVRQVRPTQFHTGNGEYAYRSQRRSTSYDQDLARFSERFDELTEKYGDWLEEKFGSITEQCGPFHKIIGICVLVGFISAIVFSEPAGGILFFTGLELSALAAIMAISQPILHRKFNNPYHFFALCWLSIYLTLVGAYYLLWLTGFKPSKPFETFGVLALPLYPTPGFLSGAINFFDVGSGGPTQAFIFVAGVISTGLGISAGKLAYRVQQSDPLMTPIIPNPMQVNRTFTYRLANGNLASIDAVFVLPDYANENHIDPPSRQAMRRFLGSCAAIPPDDHIISVLKHALVKIERHLQTNIEIYIVDAVEQKPGASQTEPLSQTDTDFEQFFGKGRRRL